MQEQIIGILEDDEDMREYLIDTINQTEGLRVGFACEFVKDAIEESEKHNINLCLVDLQLPDGSGLDFVRHVKKNADCKVLILTVLGDRTSVLLSLQTGADGYLLKDTSQAQIQRDISATLNGEAPISPQAASHLLKMVREQTPMPSNPKAKEMCAEALSLTEREVEVLNMFARGMSYKETAAILNISHHTVSDHVKSIYKKLSVHSRNEAVFEATQMGIIY